MEADWQRSKERGKTERLEVQNCKEEIRLVEIENPKIKTQKVFRPDYSYRPEQAKTGRNFSRGGTWGCLVPVCIPVRDFPSVPTGTKRIIQH